MTTHYVYIWAANINGSWSPFYVGQGRHRKGGTHKAKYGRMYCKHREHVQSVWDKYQAEGTPLRMDVILDDLTQMEANDHEANFIAKFGRIADGGSLVNVTAGWHENPCDIASCREKWRESTTSRWQTEEYREKALAGMRESWTDERRVAASQDGKLRWEDPAYRASIISKHTAQRNTPEGRAQQAARTAQPIEYAGVQYPSKGSLAKALGLSYKTFCKRLRDSIPLDAPKNIGGKGKKRGPRRPCE